MVQMKCVSVKQHCNRKVFNSKSIRAEMSQDKILQKHNCYPLIKSSLLTHKVLNKVSMYGLDKQIGGLKTENSGPREWCSAEQSLCGDQ